MAPHALACIRALFEFGAHAREYLYVRSRASSTCSTASVPTVAGHRVPAAVVQVSLRALLLGSSYYRLLLLLSKPPVSVECVGAH